MMKKKNKKTEEKIENASIDADSNNQDQAANEQPCKKAPEKSELELLQEKYDNLEDKFRRLSADYANYQKRLPKQVEESVAYKVESFIKSLLPGIDNFDHALAHSKNADLEGMIKGLDMVYNNLLGILKSQGLEQIDAAGEKFDPNCHQAVMQKADEEKKDGIILEQYQKGYKLNDRLIRPAMVVVNKLPIADTEPEQTEEKGCCCDGDCKQDCEKE